MSLTPVMMVDNGRVVGGGSDNDDYTEISYSDWLELTPEEQETGKWDVIGFPGADGTISIDLMTKLWENPSSTSAFASQDITLSSNNYDLLLIIYIWTISSQDELSIIVEKGKRFVLSVGLPSAYGSRNMSRYCSFTSDTVINFGDGRDSIGASSSTLNNDRCVPTVIYGIKLHHTVEIKAIAPEVSTSASKCMLSDGETSVEEAVDAITPRTVTGTTLADLAAAIDNLTNLQKIRAKVQIGDNVLSNYYLSGNNYAYNFTQVSSKGPVVEYRLTKLSSTPQMQSLSTNGTTATITSVTVTSWTLYY